MATSTTLNVGRANAVRKKLQFRDTRSGVMPNTIDAFSRLTLDAATKAALTHAGAKLTVEIDTAGTRVFLADRNTGALIGGPEDLARLGGIRSFVSRERKEAQGVEVAREITQLAFKASLVRALKDRSYVQGALEGSYGASVRPLLAVIRRLDDNLEKLHSNTSQEHRKTFETILKGFFVKIKNCYFHQIVNHTTGDNTKGALQELLFNAGVPEYVHTRLTSQGLVLDRAQELARVLFPSDPSKGLSLTIKEWRDASFREKLGNLLLSTSSMVCELVNNTNFLRSITKIDPNIALDDEGNPSVAKLLKCRVAVMPPMKDSRYVTEPASKTKAGWKFPSPSMDSIQGAMNALSTALMRVYSANLQSVDLVGDYYATIVPGAVSKASVTPTNNFYVQWAAAPEPTREWLDRIQGGSTGTARSDVWRWIRIEMRLSEKAEAGKALANALFLKEDGNPDPKKIEILEVEIDDPKDNTKKVIVKKPATYAGFPAVASAQRPSTPPDISGEMNLLRPLTATEEPYWKKFQKDTFPSHKKKGKKSVPLGSTLTRLTPQGLALVAEIEPISELLAERMRIWLRGFSDERVQRAAVKLANASFDELFISDAKESDDDRSDDESDEEE